MLNTALEILKREINIYLNLKAGKEAEEDDIIVLSNVAGEDGKWAIPNKTLGLSLINIEEERVFREQKTAFLNGNGETEHYNPEIKLNIYVLIAARWVKPGENTSESDYKEGLKQLSRVISFLQAKYVFTQDNSPLMASIDPDIQKLVVELYSFSFEQMYNFWSAIGAEYLPSVLYKVRLLKFQEKLIQDKQPVLGSLDIATTNNQ